MSEPRDFRDPADLDDAVDAIRIAPREQAHSLLLTCLETAYHQGRRDMLEKLIGEKRGSSGAI